MALFGFLRKKEEEPVLQSFDVSMAELPGWFESALGDDLTGKTRESEQLYKELVAGISGIRQKLENLDSARLVGNERLHIAANMIKESFVKKKYAPLNSLASLYNDYRPGYRYFLDFQERSIETIKELKTSTPKQTILLSRYFKKESNELIESIKHAEDASLKLRKFLKTGSGSLGLLNAIKSTVKECSGLLRESAGLEERASGLRKEISQSGERRRELEKRFLRLLKSREWKMINSREKELATHKEELRDAEMVMNSELSKIRRPVKMLEHTLSRKGKLTPIHKNTFRDFIRDPLKTVMPDKGLSDLQSSLKDAGGQAGKLDSRELREIDLEGLVERSEKDIPDARSRYLELREQVRSVEKELDELSKLSSSKQGIEGEIRKSSEQTGMLEEELKSVHSSKSRIAEQITASLRDIETRILEEVQKKVVIRV